MRRVEKKMIKSLFPWEEVARLIKAKRLVFISSLMFNSCERSWIFLEKIRAFITTTILISSMRGHQESRCSSLRFAPSSACVIHLERPTMYPTYRLSCGISALLILRYVPQSERGRAWSRALNNSHVLATINMQHDTWYRPCREIFRAF